MANHHHDITVAAQHVNGHIAAALAQIIGHRFGGNNRTFHISSAKDGADFRFYLRGELQR
ncbi:MAG: hypothetical protein ABJA67_01845 [Chthonomonadales bacterium]